MQRKRTEPDGYRFHLRPILPIAGRRRRVNAVVAIVALDVASAALCLFGVLRPPMPDTPVVLNAVFAAAAVALAVAVSLARGRRRWRLISANVVVHVLATSVSVTQAATGEGAMSAAVSYVLLTLYVAAFFPPKVTRMHVPLVVVCSAAAIHLSDAIVNPLPTWLPIALAVVVSGLLFSAYVEDMRQLTLTDALTGALNRLGFSRAVAREQASSARTGEPLTVVAVDLDGFKSVNDRHGHAAGDALLVQLVADWHAILRPRDTVGRRGGDEFVLLLPGLTIDDAVGVVERMHASSTVRWSSGIAAITPGDDLEAVLRLADVRMYERKNQVSGRAPARSRLLLEPSGP